MDYAEAAYFDGNHCHHVAAWQEQRRLSLKHEQARRALDANRACITLNNRLGRLHLQRSLP